MPEQLAGDVALALVLDQLHGREAYGLQAVRAVQQRVGDGGLAGRDPTAVSVSGDRVAHRLSSIIETDHHLSEN